MVLPDSHRVSRVPWYSGISAEVWLVFAYRAITVFGGAFQPPSANVQLCNFPALPRGPADSYNPAATTAWAYHVSTVWALPISLAATQGIAFCFFFLGVLRCFSSPTYLLRPTTDLMVLQTKVTGHYSCRVSPFGYLRVKACSQLSAAFRSQPRPSSAPGAKASTTRP